MLIMLLVGAGASIVDIVTNTPWDDRVRCVAAISHSIGFAMLLHANADFIHAALFSMFEQKALQKYFLLIHIPIFITAILSSLGTGRIYIQSPNPSDWRPNNIIKAVGIIYAILGAAQILVTVYLLIRHKKVRYRERRIVVAVALSLPFAIAANVYLIATAFAGPSETLSPLSKTSTGVLTSGLFTLVPDTAILVICYWTGCLIKLAETNPEKRKRMELEGTYLTPEEIERESAVERRNNGRPPAYAETDPDV